jgi:hypothetical protein
MVKYVIEGGINFYEELYKSFDEEQADTDANLNDENQCQITGLPLTDKFVTMECNHKFNYTALYKEIYNQKFVFRSYTYSSLSDSDKEKFDDAKTDYFIKCPYCRNIQFTLLPYYEDMVDIEKRYGINSLGKSENDKPFSIFNSSNNYSYSVYGYTFKKGLCCKVLGNVDGKDILCGSKMTAPVEEMNKSFCSSHIRQEVKQYKLEKIKKQKDLKKEEKEAQKKQKEEEKEAQKKQKEEEKEAQKNQFLKIKGALKMLKKVKNVVTSQTIEIPTFEGIDQVSNLCQTILKSGTRKGQLCGNKALKNVSGCCSRHNVLAPVLETEINNI